ncbi:hypothetical protein GQ53DRAFT_20326 [Thozetella sp. PMI_491]|nr:hypothetical protein GQ53DRAFT_20326 [Thozetella sp. PMI_491]
MTPPARRSPTAGDWRRPSGSEAPASSVATLAATESTQLPEPVLESPEELPVSRVRRTILNFTSQWFLIPQGTGITAVVLHQLDYQFEGLDVISYVVWMLAFASLTVMLLLYLTRIVLFPRQVWAAIKSNQIEIACLSSISIALTSVNQMLALTFGSSPNTRWSMLSFVLWWIDMVIALAASALIPIAFAKIQPPGLAGVSPAMLLPLIAAITFAAGGGTLAGSLHVSVDHVMPMLVVSYLFLGLAMPLTIAITTAYLLRLFERHQPSKQNIFSEMMLCGPWGQGSYALQALGQALMENQAAIEQSSAGLLWSAQATGPIAIGSMFFGLVFWGQGLFWWFLATTSAASQWVFHNRGNGPGEMANRYSLTGWCLVFPWGVLTNAGIQLGKLLDSAAFRVVSTIMAVCLVVIWLVNIAFTTKMVMEGAISRKRPVATKELVSRPSKPP